MLYLRHEQVDKTKDEDNDVDGEQDGQACGSECLIHGKQAEDSIEDDQTDDH